MAERRRKKVIKLGYSSCKEDNCKLVGIYQRFKGIIRIVIKKRKSIYEKVR